MTFALPPSPLSLRTHPAFLSPCFSSLPPLPPSKVTPSRTSGSRSGFTVARAKVLGYSRTVKRRRWPAGQVAEETGDGDLLAVGRI